MAATLSLEGFLVFSLCFFVRIFVGRWRPPLSEGRFEMFEMSCLFSRQAFVLFEYDFCVLLAAKTVETLWPMACRGTGSTLLESSRKHIKGHD